MSAAPKLRVVFGTDQGDTKEDHSLVADLLRSLALQKRGWIAGYASALYDLRPRLAVEETPDVEARRRARFDADAAKAYAERFEK